MTQNATFPDPYAGKIADQNMSESEAAPTSFDWHSLKLNEAWAPDNNSMITRVPGGWLYANMQGVCFIPYSNEFQPQVVETACPFETDTAPLSRENRLVNALRWRAIIGVGRADYHGVFETVGYKCELCEGEWLAAGPEDHKASCLLDGSKT